MTSPICPTCGGYAECFDWHTDQRRAELARLEASLERRGLVARERPVDPARLDHGDADDRARDAADCWRLGWTA